jgi:predicted PurR-regulated permease PerM
MQERHETINVSTVTILKIVFTGLLLWFLFAIREILLLLLISVIISSAIDPLADYLYKKRVPRALSVLLVYIVVIGIPVLIGVLLAPSIGTQFKELGQNDFYTQFESKLGLFKSTLNQSGIGRTIQDNIKSWTGSFSSTLFNTTKGVFTGFISVVTILVVSFYLTVEENGMKNLIKHLTPYKNQAYVARLVTKIQKKMGAWILGQIILSFIIFGLTYIGLTILKVDYALVLALIAGFLEIIPIIGPIISAVPATFFAFLQSPPLALAVIILWIVVQQLENHVIVPVVMSKSVGVNPVLVILGILVGGSLGGVVGAIIAVPVLSGISVFVQDMFQAGDMENPNESS